MKTVRLFVTSESDYQLTWRSIPRRLESSAVPLWEPRRVSPDNQLFDQPIKKFPAFYGTHRFIATFSGLPGLLWRPGRPENVTQLRAHIVKCRALSEDLCRKVVTNASVRLQEVVRQNGGYIEHVLHYEQFPSLWGLILYQISNVFVIIKTCYVHIQWYDISCANLYICYGINNRRKLCFLCLCVISGLKKQMKQKANTKILILKLNIHLCVVLWKNDAQTNLSLSITFFRQNERLCLYQKVVN